MFKLRIDPFHLLGVLVVVAARRKKIAMAHIDPGNVTAQMIRSFFDYLARLLPNDILYAIGTTWRDAYLMFEQQLVLEHRPLNLIVRLLF